MDLHYHRIAANTYEVREGEGPAEAIVQRDPGASTWSGYKLDGVTRLSGPYPGSREVTAANAVRRARELTERES